MSTIDKPLDWHLARLVLRWLSAYVERHPRATREHTDVASQGSSDSEVRGYRRKAVQRPDQAREDMLPLGSSVTNPSMSGWLFSCVQTKKGNKRTAIGSSDVCISL